MKDFDILIRNGTIVDGRRSPRFKGDIAIRDGRIAAMTGAGALAIDRADKVIDAEGLIVAPGFVDLHTHYDAQLFWDPWCTISGWHGVTSLVIGNCGFGFAPCKPEGRERAMQALTRNEAVSYPAMKEGMNWTWESFPEFLDAVEATPKGVNIVSYVGIAPVMAYVMGYEEAKQRRPTREELDRMKTIIGEAIDVGACGISAQYLGEDSIQRDYDGTPMITDTMHFDDYLELASVLKAKGRGAIQSNGLNQAQCEALAEVSGANIIYNAIALECDQHGIKTENWRQWLDWTAECNQRGLHITPQVIVSGIDYQFTLEDWNLYDYSKLWRDLCMGTVAERKAKMADLQRRPALREELEGVKADDRYATAATSLMQYNTLPDNTVLTVENEELLDFEGMTIREIAAKEGKHVVDAMLDLAVADELMTTFATPPNQFNLKDIGDLIRAPFTIPGISDGGAHTKFSIFGQYSTEYLVNWVRDHKLVDLEYAHWHLSTVPAMYAGLDDRGYLAVGAPADIIVYDLDELAWTPPTKVYDLPAGDWRRVSKGLGYRYTLVNGAITFVDNECTGATPGALLRNGHAA